MLSFIDDRKDLLSGKGFSYKIIGTIADCHFPVVTGVISGYHYDRGRRELFKTANKLIPQSVRKPVVQENKIDIRVFFQDIEGF